MEALPTQKGSDDTRTGGVIGSGKVIEEFVLATRVPAGFCGEISADDDFGVSQALLEDLVAVAWPRAPMHGLSRDAGLP